MNKVESQTKKKATCYAIVDFGAKEMFTHHIPLIRMYSNMIKAKDYDLTLYLPQYANKIAFKDTYGEKKFVLNSNVFGPTRKENFPLYFLFYFMEIFFLNSLKKNSKVGIWARTIFKIILCIKPYIQITFSLKNYKKKGLEEIHILFPTADTLSIMFGRIIQFRYRTLKINLLFRMVGSESRGSLATGNEILDLNKLIAIYPDQIKVGWETHGYRDYLLKTGIPAEVLFWSPWPSNSNYDDTTKKGINDILVLGFLGMAKERKGFDLIPKILQDLISKNIAFKAIAQATIYPWAQYFETLEILKSTFCGVVEILPPVLTDFELDSTIAGIDLMILPYDVNSYSINASGLLYLSADHGREVLSFKKVGFAWEIEDHDIGFTFSEISEISDLIVKIIENRKLDSIIKYNDNRHEATLQFLSLV